MVSMGMVGQLLSLQQAVSGDILWSWQLMQQWEMPLPLSHRCSQGCCAPVELLSPQLSATKATQKRWAGFQR